MEYIRLAGGGMILASSLWTGLHAALRLRRTHEELRDLTAALELMRGEIRFSAPPFVPLCRRAGQGRCPSVQAFFSALQREAAKPELIPAGMTRRACAAAGIRLPESAMKALERLFDGFGRCDREGQQRQIQLASDELFRLSEELAAQMEGRCRSYQLLGLTVGAAMLVLVI